MNKTAIKNFAIWARNKLIADVSYDARLIGITEDGIAEPLPQSFGDTQFFDIGTAEPYSISGEAVRQRDKLIEVIQQKEKDTDYKTAYQYVIEEVAYTWFNRLIAIRFMEVNDYLPSHIRVLSSESGKLEPDLVTTPFDAELPFTAEEEAQIFQLKQDNKLDEVFRILFLKQCNALNEILPALFEKTKNYTELLLSLSVIDQDGVVYHLIHDIPEDDFNIEHGGQVEIIGWLYQYYNTELKAAAFAKNGKITKEEIPAVTQLFTPDWIVRYMVENSLGRLWVEGHPDCGLKENWKYYLEEAQQEPEVQVKLSEIRKEYAALNPEDIKLIDPCMGSGHILVYAFDVLMQIYESAGYSQRDAAKSILEHNIYGLDIDDRAYQLAYFAVMMKARQYNRRILNGETDCHVYAIQESNSNNRAHLKYFGAGMDDIKKNAAKMQLEGLLDTLTDAKEYGSILNVDACDWDLLRKFVEQSSENGQVTMDSFGLDETKEQLQVLINIGQTLAQQYDVVTTNPPYMGSSNMGNKLARYIKEKYELAKFDLFAVFIIKCRQLCCSNRYFSMITQHGWMFLGSYEKLREELLSHTTVQSVIHLGANAFDEINGEVVQTVSFVMHNNVLENKTASYFRLIEDKGENEKRLHFLADRDANECYHISTFTIKKIPHLFYGYWLNEKLIWHLVNSVKAGHFGKAKQGLITSDNDRFLRLWFEINPNEIGKKWFMYNKGGGFKRWYGNVMYVVNWENDGFEICHFVDENGKLKSRPQNIQYFFRSGLTWNDISTTKFCCRYVSENVAFDASGPTYFLDDKSNELFFLGIFNSSTAQEFMNLICQGLHYSTGHIPQIPIVVSRNSEIEDLVRENIELVKQDWDWCETSADFTKHPLL